MSARMHGLLAFGVGLTLAVPAWAEEVKVETVIVSHSGHELTTRSRQGDLTVHLAPGTQIREVSGLSKKSREQNALIPGRIIKVEGNQHGSILTAEKIEFKKNDWR